MEIRVLASGSGGNAYRVSDGHTPLLLECGIRFKELREGLRYKVTELAGCLISHSHADHAKAVHDMIKAGVDCYMSEQTAQEIGAAGHCVHAVSALQQFTIGSWTILPFDAVHDAYCLGFLLASGDERLLYLTDSAFCRYRFEGLTHLMIEANYSADILRANVESGVIDPALRYRILRNHMSLERVKDMLKANDLSRVREVHLLHLSSDNSDAARFKAEVERLTGKPTYIAGGMP